MKKERPIAVDLFAGAGGMTLGFEQAGFDVLASVEIDPIHCLVHHYNFPFWSIICRDIQTITGQEIRQLSKVGNHPIDVVFGGPPCQGFSLMGKRVLEDERNALIAHFIRLVLELQPKYFVLENVPGMAIGSHQQLLQEIFDKFSYHGYEVETNYQILNAANYGVPQNRERLFLLGCQKGLILPNYPQAISYNFTNKSEPNNQLNLPKCPTVWEAIKDLPEVENYPELEKQDWVIADYKKPSNYGKQLRCLMDIEDDYSYSRRYKNRLLTSSMRTKHSETSRERFAKTPQGKTESVSRFLKLHPKGLCNTLRAGTPSNRGAHTAPRPIHPITPRCITVREAARLHSYPDWFRFHVTKWHGFRQVGNSVPPLLAKAVAREIIKMLVIEITKPSDQYHLKKSELLSFKMTQATQYCRSLES
ncbi:DNA-cytosine methyltransferase [Rippkaea orientalis PCC 8801]|uniref:Cytosine-specific methyltransferase n=1 Tax=Rippkaea orientalis (strain PCC 8801 / RF-1) TaxID=41431 RepID=B7K0S4_RIPO1|nr:DNA cytosine methyltransferase [Rippkaea orientalis]ACK65065.1 DNA-cytosine methyltransferase [Rippkaea orientalis PCC 8801]